LEQQPFIGFQDKWLVVVFKPANLTTESAGQSGHSLQQWLIDHLKHPSTWGPHPIHRLDKVTSGWVVFALKKTAFSQMSAQWHQNAYKTYRAWVVPPLDKPSGTLVHHLERNDAGMKAIVVDAASEASKLARLTYRTLKRQDEAALLEIQLKTGRFHQIRAQLSAEGSPIVGDSIYGSKIHSTNSGISLCAGKLQFRQPSTGEQVILENWPVEFSFEKGAN
jgi:23S rRNA pseudouridine1911/1915/1917 synthase